MHTARWIPPRGVLVLAGILAAATYAMGSVTVRSFGMTRDPAIPFPVAVAIVGCGAAFTLLLAWVTWGVLRGSRLVGERLLAPDESISGMLTQPIIERLLGSDESRRWFRLPPREGA